MGYQRFKKALNKFPDEQIEKIEKVMMENKDNHFEIVFCNIIFRDSSLLKELLLTRGKLLQETIPHDMDQIYKKEEHIAVENKKL